MNNYTRLKNEFRSLNKGLFRRAPSLLITSIVALFILTENLLGQENTTMEFPTEKIAKLSNGEQMFYYKVGQGGSNILLIHGLGSDKKAWLNILPMLTEDHTLYAIDLPKYLDTDSTAGIGMKKYAEDLLLFMNEIRIDKMVVCGHSMGGQVAMHFALAYPDRIQKLILLAPAGLETFNNKERAWFETYITKDVLKNQSKEQIKKNFDINFHGDTIPESASFMLKERLDLKLDSLRYGRYIDYIITCIHSMLNEPVHQELSKINTPTLVVFGKEDKLIPNAILHSTLDVEDIIIQANLIPNSTSIILDRAGHFVQWDLNQLLSDKIKQFIKPI